MASSAGFRFTGGLALEAALRTAVGSIICTGCSRFGAWAPLSFEPLLDVTGMAWSRWGGGAAAGVAPESLLARGRVLVVSLPTRDGPGFCAGGQYSMRSVLQRVALHLLAHATAATPRE